MPATVQPIGPFGTPSTVDLELMHDSPLPNGAGIDLRRTGGAP